MNDRFAYREIRRANRMLTDNKPVLIEALRNMPNICPPRLSSQRKAYLQKLVNGALYREDNDPTRIAMQNALKNARKTVNV